MKPITLALLASFAALGALVAAPSSAQTVYRCGNAYSQVACAQGKAIDIDDSRTPVQQAQAQRVAADERRLAAEMRRDRLADARDARPAGAANLGGAPTVRHVAVVTPATHGKKPKKRMAAAPFQPIEVLVVEPAPRSRRNSGA